MTNLKPSDISRLDWLWTNYGKTKISDIISSNPSNDKILTEAAVINYIKEELHKLNTDVKLDLKIEEDVIHLYIKDHQDTILSKASIKKGSKIVRFEKFISTQEHIDKGLANKVGYPYILIADLDGNVHTLELTDLKYQGQETDSIVTSVVNSKIASIIKINNPIVEKSVDIKSTPDGIKADIVIDSTTNSAITIQKSSKGISCHYKWQDEKFELKFKALTSNEYYLIDSEGVDYGTLYFITDKPCIFFRRKKYAASEASLDYITKDEAQDFFESLNQNVIDDIEKVKATLIKLESSSDTKGSIANIVKSEIKNSLDWEILN